jgi:hypothetical protein
MFKNCHCHADTFSQNENNIYGYTDSKGLKKSMSKYATYLTKLDEFKHNICNIKDEFKPYILGIPKTAIYGRIPAACPWLVVLSRYSGFLHY